MAYQWVSRSFAFLLALAPQLAWAQIQIDIEKGVAEPIPIAISNFDSEQAAANRVAEQIPSVIRANLERSGLFAPLDPRAHAQTPAAMRVMPRFPDWRVIRAQGLVTGRVETMSDGRLRVEFRLWDVLSGEQLTGVEYFTRPDNWRRIAHVISDAIYKRLTGEDGYFDTRIVYVSESGPPNARVKRLAIMDQDGENHQMLTDGRFLVLTPRFSPVNQEITYMSYFNNNPRVYLFNIDTGQQELVGNFPGMTFAPRFSPDGNQVIMSLASDGNTDVYLRDLRNRRQTRLTEDPSIDVSPHFSPDGRQIAFNSDRGGSQQIYVMNADGTGQRRVSFGEGRYTTPLWSPRGDLIAFTKQLRGQFMIGVMRPDGSGERILSQSPHVQEVSAWAPNGRVLLYFREIPANARGQGGRTRVWSIDLTGRNERELPTPQDASDAAWSPLSPLIP